MSKQLRVSRINSWKIVDPQKLKVIQSFGGLSKYSVYQTGP